SLSSRVFVFLYTTSIRSLLRLFFVTILPPSQFSTLSLHDALPILRSTSRCSSSAFSLRISSSARLRSVTSRLMPANPIGLPLARSEEHTSELQSRVDLVCRLLLEKKKKYTEQSLHVTRRKAR